MRKLALTLTSLAAVTALANSIINENFDNKANHNFRSQVLEYNLENEKEFKNSVEKYIDDLTQIEVEESSLMKKYVNTINLEDNDLLKDASGFAKATWSKKF